MVFHDGVMLENGQTLASKNVGPDTTLELR